MNYHDKFIIDFAKRTLHNLELIKEHSIKQPYTAANGKPTSTEVTQLVNSMLGLLVFPRERYNKSIPKIKLADLAANGWPNVRVIEGNIQGDSLRDLIRLLRNSIAHCNIKFISDNKNNIRGIELWNGAPCGSCGKCSFKVELSLDDMRVFIFKFVNLIETSNSST
jgi:HEPN family protein